MAWSSSSSLAASLTLLALVALGGPAALGNDGAARRVVEEFQQQLVALAAGTPLDLESRLAALRPVVEASHDLPYIARFTLRRQWPDLTEAQRAEFVRAFTDLSVMTYATRFESVTADTFIIRDVNAASRGRIQVVAAINRPDGDPIPLDYLLQAGEGRWRIINIIADGVSDLALKRAEYQRVFQERSFAGLVEHLDELTAALRAGGP